MGHDRGTSVQAAIADAELPGVDHNAFPAYDRADVIEWLLAQRLQQRPRLR